MQTPLPDPFSNFIFTPCFPGPNDYVVDPESKRVLEEKFKYQKGQEAE